MKTVCVRILIAGLLCSILALAACSAGGGSSSGSSGATPSATTKPKPTGVPAITAATCAQLLSLAEANQITGVSATTIRVDSSSALSSCNYETKPYIASVVLSFSSGNAAQLASHMATQQQQLQQQNAGATLKSVTGLGDAAYEEIVPIPGFSTHYHLFVADGAVLLEVTNPGAYDPSGGDSAALAQLEHVAQTVLPRL